MTRIAWIDPDAAHARRALRLLSLSRKDWLAMRVPRPDFGMAPKQGWDALVLCLARGASDVPDWLASLRRWPLLLCLYPEQEALAARLLRQGGSADYVLRHDGQDHVPEVLERLGNLVEAGRADEGATLQAQLARTRTALESMSQGIFQTGSDGRVNVYNQRVLELLGFPESLMASNPTLAQLTQWQLQRGDFGDHCTLVDSRGLSYVQSGAAEMSPDLYWRQTTDGRTYEVRTKNMPDGGLVRTFTDVSDYVRVQAELQRSEARFRSLCDLSSDWYWEQDAQFCFTAITGVAARQDGRLQAMLGRTPWDIGAVNMDHEDWESHQRLLQAHQPFRDLELKRLGAGGQAYWIALSGEPILGDADQLLGYRGVGRNITERKRVAGEIERLAFYDALTGLPNRRLLLDRLDHTCASLRRSQSHAALLFIDLDNFKSLNDTRGHDVGDHLLIQVAKRLGRCLRACDTVARFGGDEFVVLAQNLADDETTARQDVEKLAHKIARLLRSPYILDGGPEHHSTPSIGVTLFGHPPRPVQELLKQADFAMYQAKAAGRNAVHFFDAHVMEAMSARSELEAELRHALAHVHLRLHYQPVVNASGVMVGAEALARWPHAQRGMISPGEFIPLAEQTGLILPLGAWVLRTACEQLATWAAQAATRHLVLSVNVSARQFRQPEFAQQVLDALRSSGAQPHLLRLELTESLLLTDTEETIAKMQYLRAQGVGFSLDDFGTGYSSLSYLKRLPLAQIKIDQSFVRDVLTDPNDAAIVRTIMALAQSLDLGVVAEGVETTGQLEFLQRHGCQMFQGYLFGRPVPAQVLERAVRPVP